MSCLKIRYYVDIHLSLKYNRIHSCWTPVINTSFVVFIRSTLSNKTHKIHKIYHLFQTLLFSSSNWKVMLIFCFFLKWHFATIYTSIISFNYKKCTRAAFLMPLLPFIIPIVLFYTAKICQKKIVYVRKMIEKRKIPRLFDKCQIIGGLNRI